MQLIPDGNSGVATDPAFFFGWVFKAYSIADCIILSENEGKRGKGRKGKERSRKHVFKLFGDKEEPFIPFHSNALL